jgi:hypothetical protein
MPVLPEEFADLEPFAGKWCLPTEPERWACRHASSIEEMQQLYRAVSARYEDLLDFLDRYPLGGLPDEARALLHLAQSFVMVSFPVEVWNGPGIPDSGTATLERVASPSYS